MRWIKVKMNRKEEKIHRKRCDFCNALCEIALEIPVSKRDGMNHLCELIDQMHAFDLGWA